MDLKDWMKRNAPGVSVNAAANAVGMSQTTLNAQVNGSAALKPETVVLLAREYSGDPIAALVEYGLLRLEEVTGVDADDLRAHIAEGMKAQRVKEMSDQELTAEARRLLDEIDRRLAESEGRALREA